MKKVRTIVVKFQKRASFIFRIVLWIIACCLLLFAAHFVAKNWLFVNTELATEENTFQAELVPTNIEGAIFDGEKGSYSEVLIIDTVEGKYFVDWFDEAGPGKVRGQLPYYVERLRQEEVLYITAYKEQHFYSTKYPMMWEIVQLNGQEQEYYSIENHNACQKRDRTFAWILFPFMILAVLAMAFALFEVIMGEQYAIPINEKIVKKFKKLKRKKKKGESSSVS